MSSLVPTRSKNLKLVKSSLFLRFANIDHEWLCFITKWTFVQNFISSLTPENNMLSSHMKSSPLILIQNDLNVYYHFKKVSLLTLYMYFCDILNMPIYTVLKTTTCKECDVKTHSDIGDISLKLYNKQLWN